MCSQLTASGSKLDLNVKFSQGKPKIITVNSEIFARTLFSRNFANAKFRENKTLAKWQNHSVVYWYRLTLS